jgi:hypothetical protein
MAAHSVTLIFNQRVTPHKRWPVHPTVAVVAERVPCCACQVWAHVHLGTAEQLVQADRV